ncbi:MAG: DNA polymerase/3'-5' exonuclease PolX [Phycisphaerales bacterium]|nr:DNA polymerase/3'-5' exonuclease PolX [Phycisphaerales bacterium]
MSVNAAIAERFSQIADMLELTGADAFRINAMRRAARAVEGLAQDLASLAADRKSLLAIQGVGARVADKIQEFVQHGSMAEHLALLEQVPPGLLRLLQIPGLGPKTVRMLWTERGITDLDGLKRIIADGSILSLPRMGAKTVENLKAAIAFQESNSSRLHLGVAMPVAHGVVDAMCAVRGVTRCTYAGSLRRGAETIGDIDVLIETGETETAREAFCTLPGVERVLVRGENKCSVRMRLAQEGNRWGADEADGRSVQVDLRLVEPGAWGAALMYFTGSKEHNVRMRERALKRGMTLSEHGLFPLDQDESPPHSRGVRPVAGATEEEVFGALGLPWIPPEVREDRGEMSLTRTPSLIESGQVRAELHAHTTASDGLLSLDQLIGHAKSRGFHTIAVTDHSRSSFQANGLSPERLRQQIRDVRQAQGRFAGIRVLAGSEVDILADGALDYDDELLAELDIVVASPHAALGQDSAQATARLVRAIGHPATRILGHPTGRLVSRRKGLEPDMGAVFQAARAQGVALEINAHWLRLDLRDTHVRGAVEAGCLIAIDCDVHDPADFNNLEFGVLTARRGWLPPEQCVNTWEAPRLHAWLRDRRVEVTP